MLSFFHRIVDFLVVNLRPPKGTNTRNVRKSGAVVAALGIFVLAVTVPIIALLREVGCSEEASVYLTMPFSVTGFGGAIVGAFRLLLATEPGQMSRVKRMTLGVTFGCGSLVFVVGLLILGAVILGKLGIKL